MVGDGADNSTENQRFRKAEANRWCIVRWRKKRGL
jgi:hypothetical protein